MNEDTNLYALTIKGGKKHRPIGTSGSARNGWNTFVVGLHALRQLPVGGTCTDEDGDTWERVQ